MLLAGLALPLMPILIEQAKTDKQSGSLHMVFASLTAFSWTNKQYGNYYANLPLPHYIFPMLAKRWQTVASPAWTGKHDPT